jgi:DNA-binding IclR family transcriptional regulator
MFCVRNESFDSLNAPRPAAPAVGKAVRVLEAVSASSEPPGISEISRRTGLGKSTVHGLVSALADEGLLAPAAGARGYRLGPWLAGMSERARDQHLSSAARPYLHELATAGDAALVGILAGEEVRIVGVETSPTPLSLSASAGTTVPLMAGALGKAYLAGMSPAAAVAFVETHAPRQFTSRSITDREQYLSAVDEARRHGHAVESGEYLPGIEAAAACFRWSGDTYFLWIVGIEAGGASESLESRGARVRAAALAIEGALRGRSGMRQAP